MNIHKTKNPLVKMYLPSTFEDYRGEYTEIWNKKLYEAPCEFVQDDISISEPNVLRGIHGDKKTWKLISCLRGKFYFIVIDLRENVDTYGKWEAFLLSDRNKKQILVPPGFGNGHYNVSIIEECIFHYKQSTYYGDPEAEQFTVKWNDPRFDIWWPCENPILSERDK